MKKSLIWFDFWQIFRIVQQQTIGFISNSMSLSLMISNLSLSESLCNAVESVSCKIILLLLITNRLRSFIWCSGSLKDRASSKSFGITDSLKYWEKLTVQISFFFFFLTYIIQLMPSLVVFIVKKEAWSRYC